VHPCIRRERRIRQSRQPAYLGGRSRPASDATKIPALCKTVIDFAHSFGRHVVAVGIEKAAGAVALVSMGCDYGQAYLLGQPMPQERFVSLLRQRRGNAGAQPEGRRC